MKRIADLTVEDIQEAEGLGAMQFTQAEIALIMDLDPAELAVTMDDNEHPLAVAIHRGALLQEAKVRKSVFDLAERGSSPAQALAVQFINRRI